VWPLLQDLSKMRGVATLMAREWGAKVEALAGGRWGGGARVEDVWTMGDAEVAAAEDGRHVSRRCWMAARDASRAESLVSVAWAHMSTAWVHCSNGIAVGFAVVVCSARFC